jgi:tripartite-type tricarboxylate transporter receptor subunit TctC
MIGRAVLLALGVISTLTVATATAQDWPSRPLRLIVPFGAGGPTDILARIIGHDLSERLGQPMVIENRPGAGGNLGTQAAINSPADGYTLLVVAHPNAINATLYTSLPFNFLNDIAPVSPMVRVTNVMEVTPSLPANTVAEFIAYAKANPGKVNFASTGSGTSAHLAAELFKSMTGVDMVHVPYRTSVSALTDLMAGQVHVFFDLIPASIPHIRAGRLRALAVTSAKSSDLLPGVPSIADTVPGFEISAWFGIGAPRGTPQAIIDRLNREVTAAINDPKVKARLAELSAEVMTGSPAEFRRFIEAETEKWGKVVKASGAKVD